MQRIWLIDNPDGVDLDLYAKDSKWKLLRQGNKKFDALDFIAILQGFVKKQGPGSRLLTRMRMCPALSHSGQTDLFYAQLALESEMKRELTDALESKLQFNNLMKDSFKPKTELMYKDEPRYNYFMQCYEDSELVLPLLKYLTRKTLCLRSYTLSIGHAKALARACSHLNEGLVRLILDNCGVDDDEFSTILGGIRRLKDFKRITYARNNLGDESLAIIQSVLKRTIPNHLEELRLASVRMSDRITTRLLAALADGCYLKKFGLRNGVLNKKQFSILQEYALNSNYLEELDISWAQVPPEAVSDFIVELSDNMSLRVLNFSHVAIFDDSEWSDELLGHLCRFLRRNRKLAHVDLTKTGLRSKHLLAIAGMLRQCQALVALHLSDNESTPAVVDEMVELTKGIRRHEDNFDPFENLPSQQDLNKKFAELREQGVPILDMHEHLSGQEKVRFEQKLQDAAIVQQCQKHKSFDNGRYGDDYQEEKYLVLTRKLGHKNAMPGSVRWNVYAEVPLNGRNPCWVTDNQVYAMAFWTRRLGEMQALR